MVESAFAASASWGSIVACLSGVGGGGVAAVFRGAPKGCCHVWVWHSSHFNDIYGTFAVLMVFKGQYQKRRLRSKLVQDISSGSQF